MYLCNFQIQLYNCFKSCNALLISTSLLCSSTVVIAVHSCRQHIAPISVSTSPNAIFVTTPNHDKEGTTFLRIPAYSLSSDGCSADVCNWRTRRLACGTYFPWCNSEKNFRFVRTASSHILSRCIFIYQSSFDDTDYEILKYYLMKHINCTKLHTNML